MRRRNTAACTRFETRRRASGSFELSTSPDGTSVQVEIVEKEVAKADSTRRGIACSSGRQGLVQPAPSDRWDGESAATASAPKTPDSTTHAIMRLDIQNFSRCCADIVRANIKFDTQLIKDLCDGPFRAGKYEQSFRNFEQFAVGFTSAVANSRRVVADGRRALTAEKGNLSGKEIQERTAAFVRSEQLINTAEREFTTILEGLRMYLRAKQG